MIEVKTKLGKTDVSVSGSLPMLCTDTTQIVKAIHEAIRDHNPEAADDYRKAMEQNLCKMAFREKDDEPDIDGVIEALEGLLKIIKDK